MYEITSTRQVQRLLPGGETPVSRYQVWLTTSTGASGFVLVKPEDWTPDRLKEILETKVAELNLAFSIAG